MMPCFGSIEENAVGRAEGKRCRKTARSEMEEMSCSEACMRRVRQQITPATRTGMSHMLLKLLQASAGHRLGMHATEL